MPGQEAAKPWRTIWFHPRETIRQMVGSNPKAQFILFSVIYGLPMMLHAMQNFAMGQQLPSLAIVIISLLFATFVGMLGISVITWLLRVTGGWLGGVGSFQQVRCAVCWSNAPNAINVVMWGLLVLLFGHRLFDPFFPQMEMSSTETTCTAIIFLVQLIVGIWSVVILLIGLSEVHQFSLWKAVLNVAIPFVLVTLVSWVLMWAYVGFVVSGTQ